MPPKSAPKPRSSSATRNQPLRPSRDPSNKRSADSSTSNNGNETRRSKFAKNVASKTAGDRLPTKISPETITAVSTFGIEFELVLAFRDDKLQDVLRDFEIPAKIAKNCDHSTQRELVDKEFGFQQPPNPAYEGRSLWPSWLLETDPTKDETVLKNACRNTFYRPLTKPDVRRYAMEPLLVAQQAFRNSGLDTIQVIGWMDKLWSEQNPVSPGDLEAYKTKFGSAGDDVLLRSMVPDYSKWTLTNDYTLVPVRRADLHKRLEQRSLGDELERWDSYGLELITRVMRFDETRDPFIEIEGHFSALKEQDGLDMIENVRATTHVHIGFDIKTGGQLKVSYLFFQHVAFILLAYEHHITQCFPRRCSGLTTKHLVPEEPPITDDDSPTVDETDDMYEPHPQRSEEEIALEEAAEEAADTAADDETVERLEAEYTGDDDVQSNREYMRKCLAKLLNKKLSQVSWTDYRDALFDKGDNLVKLIQMMQEPAQREPDDGQRSRAYMVNWCNIYEIWTTLATFKNPKPTLEFRQHPCTIEPGVIKHWVLLLQAVMQIAREKTLQTTKYGSSEPVDVSLPFAEQEASKYQNQGNAFETVKKYVTELLRLHESEGIYWENRYDRFKNDRPEGTHR